MTDRNGNKSYRFAPVLKAAAMLLIALTPFILTYSLVIKPMRNGDSGPREIGKKNLEEATLFEVGEAFEAADSKLKKEAQDKEALYQRAEAFERLLFIEEARKDYQKYLELDPGSSNRSNIESRLRLLTAGSSDHPTPKPTRYELLDQQIDSYLSGLNSKDPKLASESLAKAEQIANEMAKETEEEIGEDLISFYRKISVQEITELQEARNLRAQVKDSVPYDYFTTALEKLYRARNIFQQFHAPCEIEQTDTYIVMYLDKTGKSTEGLKLIEENLAKGSIKHHLFIQAQYLRWRGVILSNESNFSAAIESLESALQIATPLDVPKFLNHPSILLASIYYTTNNNQKAFEQGIKTLERIHQNNSKVSIQLVQVLGMTAFNLNYPSVAERYIQYSIALAKEQNNAPYLSLSLAFLGIIRSEQGNFGDAEANFTRANSSLNGIIDTKARDYTEFAVTGYYARSLLLAGKVDRSIELYKQALSLGIKTNVQQKLALSQLHQGLGECFIALGEHKRAETELQAAIHLDRQARERMEENNALLSFAASRNSCFEQMRVLKRLD